MYNILDLEVAINYGIDLFLILKNKNIIENNN